MHRLHSFITMLKNYSLKKRVNDLTTQLYKNTKLFDNGAEYYKYELPIKVSVTILLGLHRIFGALLLACCLLAANIFVALKF